MSGLGDRHGDFVVTDRDMLSHLRDVPENLHDETSNRICLDVRHFNIDFPSHVTDHAVRIDVIFVLADFTDAGCFGVEFVLGVFVRVEAIFERMFIPDS